MIKIGQAESKEGIERSRKLFSEYEAWLGLDLCFQGFEKELATLPGKYAPPDGRLYVAYSNDDLAGCIAMRRSTEDTCEMKRLYVRDGFRGLGIGNLLIEQLLADAREIGYKAIRLDTYPAKMAKAVKLYESHGFTIIAPYYANPDEGVLFMEKSL